MSEDVSATMRVGITVILVAALVATVLNLMVMSNSLLTGGQTTLQSGIDSVSQQEFAAYNNSKVSGTQVNTAINLFQGRDIAICIQTKTFKDLVCPGADQGSGYFMNYGAILSCNNSTSKKPAGWTTKVVDGNITTSINASAAGKDGAICAMEDVSGTIKYTDSKGTAIASYTKEKYPFTTGISTLSPAPTTVSISGATVGNYYIAGLGKSTTQNYAVLDEIGYLEQKQGAPNFTALLWDSNGIVQSNNNIVGCSTLGNPQYLLSSARFQSVLIKDATGSIIGIAFYQI